MEADLTPTINILDTTLHYLHKESLFGGGDSVIDYSPFSEGERSLMERTFCLFTENGQ